MSKQVRELPVWDTLNDGWTKTYGAKGTFWAANAILAVIMFCIGLIEGLTSRWWGISGLFQVIGNIVGYFLQLGIIYIGITRAKDLPINFKMMFVTFDLQLALRLVGLYILQTLIFLIPATIGFTGVSIYMAGGTAVGALLTIISIAATLFIGIRLSLCMAYVLDAASGPATAIKQSFDATVGNFWNLAGVFILQALILMVSAIPLVIGLIWISPFVFFVLTNFLSDVGFLLRTILTYCVMIPVAIGLGIGLIWSIPFVCITYGLVYKQLRNNA